VSSNAVRLSDLRPGAVCRFQNAARLDPESRDWLHALGFTPQCQVRLCQAGEPCIVQVRTTRIGLAKAVANGIDVIPMSVDMA
jgi:Fe2+ transport system protein FeoA